MNESVSSMLRMIEQRMKESEPEMLAEVAKAIEDGLRMQYDPEPDHVIEQE